MSAKNSRKISAKEKSNNALSSLSDKSEKEKYRKPLSGQTYDNALNNLQNLLELEKDLKNKPCYNEYNRFLDQFKGENTKILELYENEDKVNNADDNKLKLNDDIFEQRVIKILSDTYKLKEYNSYPYFDVEYSKKKNSNVIKIYFNKVEINVEDQKDSFDIIYLDNRDTFMTKFQEIPIIFQKYDGKFDTMTVISKDYQYSIDFEIIKNGEIFESSFIFAEINNDLMEAKNKIKELNNKKDSTQIEKEKEDINKQLESYKNILNSKKKLYSKENIINEIENKRNELIILEENCKLKGKTEKEDEEKIRKMKEEIDKYENSLKKIIIRIKRLDQELDGLFFNTEDINLKNTIGDELKIPAKSPIIVEVKNITKYKTIIENIREIQNSFNSVLSLPLILAKQDLFFIDKYIELIEGEFNMNISDNFINDFNYNLEESCLIKKNGSETIKSDISVSYTKIKDKKIHCLLMLMKF
jgi:hypothetical protein